MATIFSKIVLGEIPCFKVAESEHFIAFLDINPLKKGHVLVVPKLEEDYIFDLPDNILADMILFAKKVAIAMKKNIFCKRIGVSIIGLEVPHAHIHLIPINDISDMNFANPKLNLDPEDMREIASKIHASFIDL